VGKGGLENRVEQLKGDSNPFNARLRLGGLYDSSVGTSSDGVDEGSDTGFAATLTAGWQAPLKDNLGFRLDYSGYANFYQDFNEYNVVDQSVSVEPQYTNGPLTYSLPLAFNYAREDNKTDYYKYTLSPTLTYLIPQTDQAIAVYGTGSLINDRDDSDFDEDGKTIGAGCAYLLFFDNLSMIRFSLNYQHAIYDEKITGYEPASVSTDEREDDSLIAGLDIQYQLTEFFGIYTNYSFIDANSNVDFYDYNRHLVEAGVAFKY
jgi:hypothetical protein